MPPIAEITESLTRSLRSMSFDVTKAGCNPTGESNVNDESNTHKPQTSMPQVSPPQTSVHESIAVSTVQSKNDENNLENSWTMMDDVEEGNAAGGGSVPLSRSTSSIGEKGQQLKIGDSSVILLSPHLRSNLMREQGERDPLFFYEVVKTLGVGSMGSVARVRKRKQAVGGSARKEIQDAVKEQRRRQKCLSIPIIGNIFRLCIDDNLTHTSSKQSGQSNKKDAFLVLPPPPFPDPEHIGRQGSSILIAPTTNDGGESRDRGMPSIGSVVSMVSMSSFDPGPNHVSKIEYAMKSIHLSRVTDQTFVEELKNEISILKALDHPHIVRAIETFSHRNQIFIVMELCSGGDLYSRDPYTEETAARIISSILSAVAYMHSRKICHRDLKYENVLFVNDSPTAEVKLIDFGLSKVYCDSGPLTEGVGTIYTMAPEVLTGTYTQKADIWSVGVIAYMLLSSQMPFFGRKRRQIAEQILNCQYDFRGRRWKHITEQAKDFIEDLLVLDPEDRVDAATAMSSMWLNKRFAATTRAPHVEEETLACEAMVRYASYAKLKKMALMVVAHKSTTEEIGILRKVFQKYDSQRDGTISYDEFCEALNDSGLTPEDLRSVFNAMDLEGSGRLRYTEFLAATIEARGAISEERLAEAFDRLDSDDNGYISADNLAELLGKDFPRDEIDEIIRESNLSRSDQISYSEFLALWEQNDEKDRVAALQRLRDQSRTFSAQSMATTSSSTSSHAPLTDGHNGNYVGMDISLSLRSSDEVGAANGRTPYLKDKPSQESKHVGFGETIIAIEPDKTAPSKASEDDWRDDNTEELDEPMPFTYW